jgi:hypothetical protein
MTTYRRIRRQQVMIVVLAGVNAILLAALIVSLTGLVISINEAPVAEPRLSITGLTWPDACSVANPPAPCIEAGK